MLLHIKVNMNTRRFQQFVYFIVKKRQEASRNIHPCSQHWGLCLTHLRAWAPSPGPRMGAILGHCHVASKSTWSNCPQLAIHSRSQQVKTAQPAPSWDEPKLPTTKTNHFSGDGCLPFASWEPSVNLRGPQRSEHFHLMQLLGIYSTWRW